MTLEKHDFEIKDKGNKWYSYILVDNWYHIQISASKRKIVPPIYVQISSELLNCAGPYYAVYKLREIVNRLVIGIEEETISRADFFVDFITDTNLEKIEKYEWITRAEDTLKRWKRDKFTGWSIGQGGEISARLYDKTIEIEKSYKYYLKEIWEKQGWDKEQKVWRVQFQLRREFLGQISIKTFADVLEKINDVWRYCTHDWLRLAIDDKTANRTRWKTNPLWEGIQKVHFMEGVCIGIKREVDRSRTPSDKTLFQNSKSDELMDVEGLALYLKVPKSWVYEKVHKKEIPFHKAGKFPRFRKKHIDLWLKNPYSPDLNIYKLFQKGG